MAFTSNTPGLTPYAKKSVLSTNYIDFTSGAGNDFSQQYLPEIYEKEVERYGNRTIGGFLKMVGAEIPMTSDQVVWSEQNRLHISYAGLGLTTNQVTGLPSTHGLAVGQTVIVSNTAGTVTKNAYVSAVGGTTADLLGYTSTNLQGDLGNSWC